MDFEKQRDLLIQDISNSINSIVNNLNTLNRSLNNSIQVGKEFDNVSHLWQNFYSGLEVNKPDQNSEQSADEAPAQDSEQPADADADEPAIV